MKIGRIRGFTNDRRTSDVRDYHYVHLKVQDAHGKVRSIVRVTSDGSDDSATLFTEQKKLKGFTVESLGGGKVQYRDHHHIVLYGFSHTLGEDKVPAKSLTVFRRAHPQQFRFKIERRSLEES